jgi:hypothetical protein
MLKRSPRLLAQLIRIYALLCGPCIATDQSNAREMPAPFAVPQRPRVGLVLAGGGAVRGARRKIDEEGLIGNKRLLLPDPIDGLVRHVLHEVVALFGRLF